MMLHKSCQSITDDGIYQAKNCSINEFEGGDGVEIYQIGHNPGGGGRFNYIKHHESIR